MIYLDHQATTPVDPRVAEVVCHYMLNDFGNPSSADHTLGDRAAGAVDEASEQLRELVSAPHHRVVFTSGATESINLALRGFVKRMEAHHPCRIGVSKAEHSAVLDTCRSLQQLDVAEVAMFEVDHHGRVSLDDLETELKNGLDLICIMAANNELGTIYPMAEVAALAQRYETPLFVDATQALSSIVLDAELWGIDALAVSAHKMYGPKGVGALVFDSSFPIAPVLSGGGGQQARLRPGTPNVPGIAGLGAAARYCLKERASDTARIKRLRDVLELELRGSVEGLVVNGDLVNRLPGSLHVSVPDLPNKAIIARIRDVLAVSTGAACSSGIEAPSHVLQAAGLPPSVQEGALRISVGRFNTDEEIATAASLLIGAVTDTRASLFSRL